MAKYLTLTGNAATAWGIKLSKPQVIAAYPITPQTTIVEYIAEFIANGELDARYIKVESEHSALAACIAAENTGVRTFTATSAHGLALMHEMLHWAAGARLPIVIVNANRAMGPPWSIWADHLDSMSQRDTGWLQSYAENNQEILDSMIMSYKVGEQRDIMLPTLVCEDAFYLTHTVERVAIPPQEDVDGYLPPYDPEYFLDLERPMGFGSLVMPDNYYEFRYKMQKAMDDSRERIRAAIREFKETFGRDYHGLVEEYRTEDAEIVLFGMGTLVSTARQAVDELRSEGEKVGLVKVRYFRPFPYEEIRSLADRVQAFALLERVLTFSYNGPLYSEIAGALYNHHPHGGNGGRGDMPLMKDY
ncbi:MAG: pyruvate ferredoxin oxidoreductase, partial [Thermoplasmata archaeon]|nr:pyruvate ferredoxin oxidoreductase [Thermoplasmata archaeon]